MSKSNLVNEYFNWLCDQVCNSRYPRRNSHRKLLKYLFNREFVYILELDKNRFDDGLMLRYRFNCTKGYSGSIVDEHLGQQCSILEMMVALALRCERTIMDDPDIGNRTPVWFWTMIFSLGLDEMSNINFDPDEVDYVINRFLNREYKPNGEGGLFIIDNCKYDLRDAEIWYQMCWYLNSITEK